MGMAKMQRRAWNAIAAGLVGAAFVGLGPSSGHATTSKEVVEARAEVQRIESQRRARLVRERTKRLLQQRHFEEQSSSTTSTTQAPALPGGGLAAGDTADGTPLSAWGDVTASFSENAADIDRVSVSLGGDAGLGEQVILGGFVSYTNSDTDISGAADAESNGVSFGPYGSIVLTDFLDLDASVGGAFDQVDVRNARDNDTDTFFVSSNLNAHHYVDNFGVRGRVGVVYSDAGIENASDIQFGQIQLGLEGSYYVADVLGAQALPSIVFEYNNDFKGTPGGDDDEFILGTSVYVFSEGPFSGSFDYRTVLDRSDFESHIFAFGLSYSF